MTDFAELRDRMDDVERRIDRLDELQDRASDLDGPLHCPMCTGTELIPRYGSDGRVTGLRCICTAEWELLDDELWDYNLQRGDN